MGEAEDMVRVRDLRKRYDTLTAVDGVTFDIVRGEIFGLLGPNGAGKTTLISMIAGLLPPTEGEICVAGHEARRSGLAIKRALGLVPQELAIYLRLTGRENLEFFGQLYGLRGAALTARMQQMLALVGLTERADSRAETYSGGMKRRLNLAAGLMHNPQLLLLDEPTVGVDPQSRNHIFEGVRELNRQGLTVLYTSHYMEEVEALCHRVGIMDRGKLVACDTVANLIANQGGTVIEVEIGPPASEEALLANLHKVDAVQNVELIPPRMKSEGQKVGAEEAPAVPTDCMESGKNAMLRVRAEHPNRALPGLISALNTAGVSLISLSLKQPNLEDVFLALTGKSLRD
jgi:ABC-2 type transport system ATP-binding protein